MSDFPDIELLAARHFDPAAVPAWAVGQATPLDELMAREVAGGVDDEGEAEPLSFSRMFRLVLVYCFTDAASRGWDLPVWRALAIVRNLFRGDMAGRVLVEPRELRSPQLFPLSRFVSLVEDEPQAGTYLRLVMRHLMPFKGSGWERDTGKRLFILAKAFLPMMMSDEQLSRDRVRWVTHELSYEQLAGVFGELPAVPSEKDRGRARARWHALMRREIELPVAEAGEEIHLHFSKSATTREKYRQAQLGNRNRRGGRRPEE